MIFSSTKLGLNRRRADQHMGGSQSGSKVVPSSVAGFLLGLSASKVTQVHPVGDLRTPSLAE
eukprot:gene4761-5221_t